MFRITRTLINEMMAATKNGKLIWYNAEEFICCEADFKGSKYIVCRYPLEDNTFDVSFNKLNRFNSTIRPFREFSVGDTFYEEILELATLAWEKRKPLAVY